MVPNRSLTKNLPPTFTSALDNANQIPQAWADSSSCLSVSPSLLSTTNVVFSLPNHHHTHYCDDYPMVFNCEHNGRRVNRPNFETLEGHSVSEQIFSNEYHCQHMYNNPSFYNNFSKSFYAQPPLDHLPWKLYDNCSGDRNLWFQNLTPAQGQSINKTMELELCAIPPLPSSNYFNNGSFAYPQLLSSNDNDSWIQVWRKSLLPEHCHTNRCTLHNRYPNAIQYSNEEFVSPCTSQMIFGCGTGTLSSGMSASLFYMGSSPHNIQGQPSLALVSGQCRDCAVGCLDRSGCGCRFFPGSRNVGCFFTLCGATERLAHLFNGLFAS